MNESGGSRKKRKCTLETDEIIRLYQEGYSTAEIGNMANVSSKHIGTILTDNNVEKRPRGSWKRKYKLNEDYFKTWSNNMAYILGFFIADGFIATAQQTVSFAQKEKYILENIKQEIRSNQPLYQNENTGVYLLNLNSKMMKKDLMEIHGITSNKSYDVHFPYVPAVYLHHFIRGYFDGDGNINYPKYVVSFVGGSYAFMNSLKTILQGQGFQPVLKSVDKHHRVYISGRRTIKRFSEWIYYDKGLYLKRKYEEFQQEPLELNQLQDRKTKRTKAAVAERKQNFLNQYTKYRCINKTCEVIGIRNETLKNWLKKDLNFKTQFEQQSQ